MDHSKNYYKDISFIRLLACLAVLLYHIGILKGGYLAVCTFFVLSGYLSCVSCFKKEKFSLKSYYLNKLKHLYLPLVIVVFISVAVISFFPNINWFNLKPETTSVLFGYNNFWQLNANLDYFARHVNSPFMHFWYMGIMLQFDLIFPVFFILLRKIGENTKKIIPCLITLILGIISSLYFYKMSLAQNIMITYYHTFTRVFSLLFGVLLGFIHSYYGSKIIPLFKGKYISKVIFCLYLFIMLGLFVFVDNTSSYFAISMIIVSLITCRLIAYGTLTSKNKLSIFDKIVKSLSNVSYEIYLVQYPIIFLFQYINMDEILKIILIIILTIIISYLLHLALDLKSKNKRILKRLLFIIVLIVSLYGGYQYVISEDHTKEMQELETKLNENEKIMQQRQKEYAEKMKQEQNAWLETLENLENYENELKTVVSNLSVVGIGDSVMLGAVDNLYGQFPNGYFDAQVSRTAWVLNGILKKLVNNNLLGEVVVINLGANGDCSILCKKEIMNTIGNRKVFWLNTTNDTNFNKNLIDFASNYSNLYVIDWKQVTNDHPEYFIADKIHLTNPGKEVFTKTIYDAIYQAYLNEYNQEKDKIIKEYEEKLNNKITLIGNNILLNAYDYLKVDFESEDFIIDPSFDYDSLKEKIKEQPLNNKIVFAFDNSLYLNNDDYQNIISLCSDHEIYIVNLNSSLKPIENEAVTIIDFYQEIIDNPNYLRADRIHLTDEGNKALSSILNNVIKGIE